VTVDPAAAAEARDAGLRYSSDASPGISRRRAGRGFRYIGPGGKPVGDAATLGRIRRLVIPPAWSDVWICPDPFGHLQVTGRDARGRKQYRYHPRWRTVRDAAKFDRMLAFSTALPRIRRRVRTDLARQGLPKVKVVAAVVRLLEATLVRVGNDEYARENRSFGLTTLLDRHAEVRGQAIRFRFRGKGGRMHEVGVRDRRLAAVIRRCQELPGQELFGYLDERGKPVSIGSDDVNDYLREISGDDFTAKDFRTWAGTVLAYRALCALDSPATVAAARRNVVEAVRSTAEQLGNTVAVCRSSYIHPTLLEAYVDDDLRGQVLAAAEERSKPPPGTTRAEERAVARLLRRWRRSETARARARAVQ
jgi:DNA topoisomerase-1